MTAQGPRASAVGGSLEDRLSSRLDKIKAQQEADSKAHAALQEAQHEATKAAAQVEPQEQQEETIYDVIEKAGGPSREELEDFKQRIDGEVHMVFLGDDPFVYRTLLRGEWQQLQTRWAQSEHMTQDKRNEDLIDRCLVWPDPDGTYAGGLMGSPGGLVDSLTTAIMWSSLFLPEQYIVSLINKL